MTTYTATTLWSRGDVGADEFVRRRYSRRHVLRFDAGFDVPASASPHTVRVPYADPSAVDPEEAFIAALSSCHLLWFLHLVAEEGFCADSYEDAADGTLAKDADGRMAMTVVTLRPRVVFSGERRPSRDEVLRLHHSAHEECFIANSVRTKVRCEPLFDH
jgi:organic hydroperoxide reductase OsmC/OhrA